MDKERIIVEGGIKIILPNKVDDDDIPRKSEEVFYNPKQIFNRDISVLCLKTYIDNFISKKDLILCDAFSASGIRGLRYGKEIDNLAKIILNDVSPKAISLIEKNVEINQKELKNSVEIIINENNATDCLLSPKFQFDIIDIDPFGSPARFLYPGTLNLTNKGIICITATDMTVLTGVYPEKTFKNYGITHITRSLSFCHEVAIRILISASQRVALQQGFGLIPIFSFAADHYVRIFLKRTRNKQTIVDNTGFIAFCSICDFRTQIKFSKGTQKCPKCLQNDLDLIGPIWLDNLVDREFLKETLIELDNHVESLKTFNRIKRLLKLLEEESVISVPWFYSLHDLCKNQKNLSAPPTAKFCDYLNNKGYQTTLTSFSAVGIRTTLSADKIREEIKNYQEEFAKT